MQIEYFDQNPFLNKFPMSNRIITETLTREDRFDVKFNPTNISNKLRTDTYIKEHKSEYMKLMQGNMKYEFDNWINFLGISLRSFKFIDETVDSLTQDYVLYTSRFGSVFDFYPIKKILEKGFRVILGGQITTIRTAKEIRKYMKQIGCKRKHLKNLAIISGYIDLTTDLYKIITDFKDMKITDNDFTTFWQCENDYMQKYLGVLQRMPSANVKLNTREWGDTQVFTIFDNRCWWGKCRFCFMPSLDKHNFISGVDAETIANNLIRTCEKYQTNNLYITNDYFRFTTENEKVLDILIENGIKIGVYGGVLLLKDKAYIEKLNKYVSYLMIGLESCDDFALKYIDKGYTYGDIYEAFDNVIKHCKRSLYISPCIINDLPYQSETDVIESYTRIGDLQNRMTEAGFIFHIKTRLLNIGWPNTEQMIDNKHLKIAKPKSSNMSGNHLMWKYFEELGIFDHSLYKFISSPLERYDSNGKVMKSDMFIVPKDIYKNIFM